MLKKLPQQLIRIQEEIRELQEETQGEIQEEILEETQLLNLNLKLKFVEMANWKTQRNAMMEMP